MGILQWMFHALGFDYGLPYGHVGAYNAWSGFGSDIAEFAILGGLATVVRKHNCEIHKCWRLGRHQTSAGHHVCRRHHPDDHLTVEKAHAAHHAAAAPAATPMRKTGARRTRPQDASEKIDKAGSPPDPPTKGAA